MDPKPPLNGACYCRAVTYEVANAIEYALNCHCKDCQRTTGSAFKPFAAIPAAKFAITAGAEHLRRDGDDRGHNAFCGRCSSLLYSLVRDGAFVHVTLGTLQQSPDLTPTAHIFVRSKAPWHVIGDSLPQYAE